MVGRLPNLKYFDAASSNSRPYSSVGWRHETSACVWTSKATRSSKFILAMLVFIHQSRDHVFRRGIAMDGLDQVRAPVEHRALIQRALVRDLAEVPRGRDLGQDR